MTSNDKRLTEYSPYLEHFTQSEYSAFFDNGNFIDVNTLKPIELNNGTPVRIIVANKYIPDKDVDQHLKVEERLVYNEGEEFHFYMHIHDQDIRFSVRNHEKIYVIKKGNKIPHFINTSCEVYDWRYANGRLLPEFTPVYASSFNEAFTRISEKHRGGNRSHVCNIYNTFYDKNGEKIGWIRDAAF